MIYTGKGNCPDSLKLSGAFEGKVSDSFLELRVNVYKEDNVKGIIHEFISVIQRVRKAVAEGKSMEEAVKTAIRQYQEGYEISEYFAQRKEVFELLGEAITLEEYLELRDEANASVLREELREEVTQEVTKQVTQEVKKEVTMKDIYKTFKILTSVGTNQRDAVQAIMREYHMPEDQVLSILQKS